MRRALLPLVLILSVVTLSGCAFLSQLFGGVFQKPRLSFKNASLASASLSDATVNLTWTLSNPNPIGLEIASIDYAFFVEGKQVVAGKPPRGLDIGAEKRTELVFPANVKFADIVPVVQTFLEKDTAKFKASGTIGFQTPIGVLRFPLSKEGEFAVPKLPQVKFQAPTITNITASGATIEFPLQVTNKNGFPIPIDLIAGGLKIAGANVGSIKTQSIGSLTAKGTQTVKLPLTINFASALSAANAIRQGRATVAFDGSLKSGSVAMPLKFSQNLNFKR